ncbi:GntR family transcriptional regulator [Rubrivivax albus]|uniref:GntR family transcriptional regulator n=1 Tax=Rubrivivax albus TaxID=2499835 RepID=A0A437K0K8_9BURK|nr:GntR family transcriptional regulator [Rubrivivax albus]RVT53803.1 GntR family transcriptional regulator [Rubrivivax albus]
MPTVHPPPAFQPIVHEGVGVPLYRVVARRLLAAIESGAMPPGSVLPNERDLASQFGVSIGTLRQAVGELVASHVLLRRQGRGTFVAHHDAERFLFHFFHVERADGLREAPEVETIRFERGRLDDDAADALGLRPGSAAWRIENRLRLQGRAVVHDRLQLPLSHFRGLTAKRFVERPSTIYRLYQDAFAITVLRARERVRAVAADADVAQALGITRSQPVLEVRRTALTFGDRPVEYRVSTVVTGAHEYVQTLSRH